MTISNGFWLFDTPCTQALWQAVMGDNPSAFRSSDRPVENVSLEDVQRFLQQINELVPSLELELPTEAQWEYACRAGKQTAIYTGEIGIMGDGSASALDSIAWYSYDSGSNVIKGLNDFGWPETVSPQSVAATLPVGLKLPNPLGLYDMLGNVWEWCADRWRLYAPEPVSDPVGPNDPGVNFVLRGGSITDGADRSRCAYRGARPTNFRGYFIGFRCARVQEDLEAAKGR